MTQPPVLPPEGWYPNPENPEQQRWWDGRAWTEHVAVGAPMAPGYEQQSPYQPQQQPYQQPAEPQQSSPSYGQQYQPYAAQQAGSSAYPTAYPAAYPTVQPGYAGYGGYQAPAAKGVLPDGAVVAGWWWRVLARFIDGLVTAVPTALFGLPLLRHIVDEINRWVDEVQLADRIGAATPTLNTGALSRDFVLLGLIGGAVTIVYEVLMLKLAAGTLGKLACGLRVRAWDRRGPLSWAAVAKRVLTFQVAAAVPQVGSFYYLLDVLWPLWDGRRQALHDKVAGTAVVKKHDAVAAPQTYGGASGFGGYQSF